MFLTTFFPSYSYDPAHADFDGLRYTFADNGAIYSRDREEEIYEDICYITFKLTEVYLRQSLEHSTCIMHTCAILLIFLIWCGPHQNDPCSAVMPDRI